MKKLLGCFLCVMLLFCLSTPAAADSIFDVNLRTATPTAITFTPVVLRLRKRGLVLLQVSR